jgi:hypothetical protein
MGGRLLSIPKKGYMYIFGNIIKDGILPFFKLTFFNNVRFPNILRSHEYGTAHLSIKWGGPCIGGPCGPMGPWCGGPTNPPGPCGPNPWGPGGPGPRNW